MAGSRPRCCRVNSPPRREGNLLHSLQQQLVPLGALSVCASALATCSAQSGRLKANYTQCTLSQIRFHRSNSDTPDVPECLAPTECAKPKDSHQPRRHPLQMQQLRVQLWPKVASQQSTHSRERKNDASGGTLWMCSQAGANSSHLRQLNLRTDISAFNIWSLRIDLELRINAANEQSNR